jgi:alpha/beta hydrolase family protein
MASSHQKTTGQPSQTRPSTTYKDAPTRTVVVGGTSFAYRELGMKTGVPVIFLNHLTGVLDNWDPRVVDGIAAKHRVITLDNRGVGASQGSTPDNVEAMARDAVAFIRARGFEQVDLLGFSLGGFIAQVIATRIAPGSQDHSRGHGSCRRGRHRPTDFCLHP